jgi:hypothetical protein
MKKLIASNLHGNRVDETAAKNEEANGNRTELKRTTTQWKKEYLTLDWEKLRSSYLRGTLPKT